MHSIRLSFWLEQCPAEAVAAVLLECDRSALQPRVKDWVNGQDHLDRARSYPVNDPNKIDY